MATTDPASETRSGQLYLTCNFKWPADIPKKPYDELTPEQQLRIKNAYRFASFTPGIYQVTSGLGGFNP